MVDFYKMLDIMSMLNYSKKDSGIDSIGIVQLQTKLKIIAGGSRTGEHNRLTHDPCDPSNYGDPFDHDIVDPSTRESISPVEKVGHNAVIYRVRK